MVDWWILKTLVTWEKIKMRQLGESKDTDYFPLQYGTIPY